jgi:ribosomal protein S17
VGDEVVIKEVPPMSREKRWKVIKKMPNENIKMKNKESVENAP